MVYLGDRADGEYHKRVAIKLITGRREPDLEQRFRQERQILAQLEHPGIAHLLDGGTTEAGHPYLVMEYVEGPPLLAWCDENRLTIAARLTLFLSVCDAVAHAHHKLIVHRDLKPGNILVTPDGDPKLLDFGLARVVDSDTETTQAGPALMTVSYASPEQIRGALHTVASDVYSLGVILYELLTAHRPYQPANASFAETVRATCEQEPVPPPLAPISEADAVHRAITPERLRSRLAGDLETILLKALAKDPRLRYSTVDNFAADLRRHINGQPIHARPATFSYRAGKFVRRHRIAVPTATLAILLIVAFAALSWWQWRRAQRRFNDVQNLAHSVLFEFHDAIEKLPGSTAARELLVRRALEYLENLSQESAGDPRLAREIALGYGRIGDVQGALGGSNLGRVPAALESYRKAEQILAGLVARAPSDDSLRRDYLRIADGLANMYEEAGEFTSAHALSDKNLVLAKAVVQAHPRDPEALHGLMRTQSTIADVLTVEKKYDQAIAVRLGILDIQRRIVELLPTDANAQIALALAHKKLGALVGVVQPPRYEDARREYEQAREIDERQLASSGGSRAQLDLSYDYSDLGWVAIRLGDSPGGLAYYRKALALRQAAAAADPNDYRAAFATASSHERIGRLLRQMGDAPAGIIEIQQALVLWQELADRPDAVWSTVRNLADAHSELGACFVAMRAFPRAATEYDQASEIYKTLRDRGVLPQSLNKQMDELKSQADKCRRSTCVIAP